MAVLRYFYTTPGLSKNVKEALDDKVDKEEGMGLSQNDYTDTEKDKLEGVEDGAEVNVLADWNEQDTESDAYILNKPSVPILDPSGQIPASYLPSYVDDVLEYPTYSSLPLPGETGKIYVTTDTDLAYRWSGSTYVEISKSIITGVKGDAETDYRIGNVNLTAANIGLANVANLDLSKAIKSITRSGTTFTYTCLDGTTGTFTLQDNNTTYSAGTGLSLSNTTFSLALTKKLVTDALGYTPPTTDTNTTYSAGSGLSLSGTTFSLALTKALVTTALGYTPPTSDTNTWRTVLCNGTSIGNNTLNLKAGTNVTLSNSNGTITISSTDTNTWPSKVSLLTNDSGYITGITKAMVTNALGYTPPTTDTNTWRTVLCNGTSIGNNTLNIKAGTNVSLSNSNGTITITSTDTNTWRPLGTGASDACAGNDSRLSNSRPASDVYSWAKASTKPSYAWSEITSKPCSFYSGTCSKTTSGSVDIFYVSMSLADAQKVYSMEIMPNKSGFNFAAGYTADGASPANAWRMSASTSVGVTSCTYRYIKA